MPAGARQLEQAASTRAALVAAARRLFVGRGYFATGTEEIVAAADVTRGALYHHFADKQALFRAVFDQVGAELLAGRVGALREPVPAHTDSWEQLRLGLQRFMRTVADEPEVQRITLIDGPAVLGWAEWTALEERHALNRIEAAVERAVHEGVIDAQPPRALAHLLLGLVNAGALAVANAAAAGATETEIVAALDNVLRGMRRRGRRRLR